MAKVWHFEIPEAIPNTSGVSSEVQQLPVAEPPVVWNDLNVSYPSEPQSIIKECDTSALLNVKNRKLRNLTYYNNNIIKLADVLKRSYHTISTFTLKEHKHCVWDHHFDIDWMDEVKIIRESQLTWVFIRKYTLMRDRRMAKIINTLHALHSYYLLTSILSSSLSLRVRWTSLSASTSFWYSTLHSSLARGSSAYKSA